MPIYKYYCESHGEFDAESTITKCDEMECIHCGMPVKRLFEGKCSFRYQHRSNTEKGIHRDLVECNNLERTAAYDQSIVKHPEEERRINREIEKLKFTD